jgi:hypothetical protein
VHNISMYALLAFVILFQSPVLIHFYLSELYQDKYSLSQFQNSMYPVLHIHFHCKAFVNYHNFCLFSFVSNPILICLSNQ